MLMIAPALLAWAMTTTTPPAQQPATADEAPSEARVNPSQPDFTLVALPTNLRVPLHKSAFRVTHRFTRPLGEGDFGDLASDFFALDSSAQIGLEYRFGIVPGGQIGIHRTNDRTIEFFGEYSLLQQGERWPLGLSAFASVDGTNNFRDSYTPALAAIFSRELGRHGAVYLEPMFVSNSNIDAEDGADPNDTFMIGVGGRFRIRPTVYVVAEVSPRVSGFHPGTHQASFAIEKRVGGHSFQLNFSNSFGTTMGQIARGGVKAANGDTNWYMGFNISRKFF
jgi:hypothetical protein